MSELTVVRFFSRCDSDPYRCSLPNDQSGEYYRKSEVDAELERLRADLARVTAERDDYHERWEQTGCTRHHAMETAIKLNESCRRQLEAAIQERDALRDIALALRQHLALFCGPDDAIAQALFERADAVICGAGAVLKAGRDQESEEDIHATVDRMRSITKQYHPNGLPACEPERSEVYEALTIQALRIAAAQERWGLDGPGIIREFVGELGEYERGLAKREEIRIDYLDEPGDDTAEGEG